MYLLAIWELLTQIISPCIYWFDVSFFVCVCVLNTWNSFCVLDINALSYTQLAAFSPVLWLVFSLYQSHLSVFEAISTRDLFRKTLPMSIYWNVFLILLLQFKYTEVFDLFLIKFCSLYRMRDTALVSRFNLWISSLASHICWRSCLFPQMYMFENFVEH